MASATDPGCAGALALCREEGTSFPEYLVHSFVVADLDCRISLKRSEQAFCHFCRDFCPFSAGAGLRVPFALRDMEEMAATAGEGGVLCRRLPLGVLWLSRDAQIITAVPSVRGVISHPAGLSPEGLHPPLLLLLAAWPSHSASPGCLQ